MMEYGLQDDMTARRRLTRNLLWCSTSCRAGVAETHAYLSKHPMRSRRMIKDQAEYGSNKLLVVVDRIIILSLAT